YHLSRIGEGRSQLHGDVKALLQAGRDGVWAGFPADHRALRRFSAGSAPASLPLIVAEAIPIWAGRSCQANQNSGKPWRNTKGLPFAGPARMTCNAMPLIWTTRNSRGERTPDTFIRPISYRVSDIQHVINCEDYPAPTSEL